MSQQPEQPTKQECIFELQRILTACKSAYPSQVAAGKITAEDAYTRITRVTAAIGYLQEEAATTPRPFPSNPMAKSVSELATPKQIVMIRAICRDLDIDVELEMQESMKLECKPEELSRRAASSFIDHLKNLQEGNEIPIVRRAS